MNEIKTLLTEAEAKEVSEITLSELPELMKLGNNEKINLWKPKDAKWEDNYYKVNNIRLDNNIFYIIVSGITTKDGKPVGDLNKVDSGYLQLKLPTTTELRRKFIREKEIPVLQKDSIGVVADKELANVFEESAINEVVSAIKNSKDYNLTQARFEKVKANPKEIQGNPEKLYIDAFLASMLRNEAINTSDVYNTPEVKWLTQNGILANCEDLARNGWSQNGTLRALSLAFENKIFDFNTKINPSYIVNLNNSIDERIIGFDELAKQTTLKARLVFNIHLGELNNPDVLDDYVELYNKVVRKLKDLVPDETVARGYARNFVFENPDSTEFEDGLKKGLVTITDNGVSNEAFEEMKKNIIPWTYKDLTGQSDLKLTFRPINDAYDLTNAFLGEKLSGGVNRDEEEGSNSVGFVFRTGDDQKVNSTFLKNGTGVVTPKTGQTLNLLFSHEGFNRFDQTFLKNFLDTINLESDELGKYIEKNAEGKYVWKANLGNKITIKVEGNQNRLDKFELSGKPETTDTTTDDDISDEPEKEDGNKPTDLGPDGPSTRPTEETDPDKVVSIDTVNTAKKLKIIDYVTPHGKVDGNILKGVKVRAGDIIVSVDGSLIRMTGENAVHPVDIKAGTQILRPNKEVIKALNKLGLKIIAKTGTADESLNEEVTSD